MADLPSRWPREAVALGTVLLVVVLVAFPSLGTQAAILIVAGGAVALLLAGSGPAAGQAPKARDAASLQAPVLARLAAKQVAAEQQQQQVPAAPEPAAKQPAAEQPAAEQAQPEAPQSPQPKQQPPPGARSSPQQPPAPAPKALLESAPQQPLAPAPEAAPKPAPQASAPAPAKAGGAPLAGGAAVLARLRQQKAAAAKAASAVAQADAAREVVVAYASQTGTAQEIARGIQAESASHGVKSKVVSLNELGFETVKAGKAPLLVIVAASTGDGDSPDNGAKFYASLRRRSEAAGCLQGVRFTVLGLGDSNYTRFMGVSRSIRACMQELGAEPFYKMGEADEVDGLEGTVDPWVAGLWQPLQQLTAAAPQPQAAEAGGAAEARGGAGKAADGLEGVPALAACRAELRWLGDATECSSRAAGEHPTDAELGVRDAQGCYSPAAPFWAPVAAARWLTAAGSDRRVLHLELDLAGSGMEYQPGDALGVTPLNEDGLVDALLARLQADGGRRFEVLPAGGGDQAALLPHLGCPCSLRAALQAGCDLTSVPRKSLLRLLGEHCADAGERRRLLHLSSRGGRDEYARLAAAAPSLLDLLRAFPSCAPPLAPLLDALPPLAPRLYSVSSSPLEHGARAHVAFSVVRIPGGDLAAERAGVATGWLERRVQPLLHGQAECAVRVPVHLRKGGAFAHPADLGAPLLMVGPGTGVTPFRGFLQHRRQLLKQAGGAVGAARLFFGCRRPHEDFLYREELEAFAADGTLARLDTAFSRAGPEKEYVQHLMLQQAQELRPVLTDARAYIFVCGDGAGMAKDVHAALLQILQTGEGGLSAEAAAAHLAAMTKAGRYVRDIWS